MPNTSINQRLADLKITLPIAPKPVASYVPTRQTGNLIHISGQIPLNNGSMIATGIVPTQVDEPTAQQCAHQCTLNALASLQVAIGDLDRVAAVIKASIFVAATPDFGNHPKIANACSDLLVQIFGQEIGQHARAAVGVASLPLNAPVEIEFVFEIK